MIPQAILDVSGGALCGMIAVGLFTLHVVTSPRRRAWVALPAFLRGSMFVTGALMMIRGIGLVSIDSQGFENAQHIPPLAWLTAASLAVTICGLAVWIVSRHLPNHLWERLAWAETRAHNDPHNIVPLVLTKREVADLAEAKGIEIANPKD